MLKSPKKICLMTVIILVSITIISVLIMYFTTDFSTFSQDKWDKYKYKRYLMIDDFEKQYNIYGMTKEELKNLLGERGIVELEDELTYVIGITEMGFGFDRYYVLTFDENNKCTNRYIIVDSSNFYSGERSPQDKE